MQIRLFLKGIHHGFGRFGKSVANAVNSVLLFVMYFVGVGLAALFTKISGTKLLNFGVQRKSHYNETIIGNESKEDYYRQF
ncbi:hypothetical protein HY484_04365 [Candidatus Woesearchaeota archaeon]|nr:hypothetical protein [Candidatus Woesearchaeota archaeon]